MLQIALVDDEPSARTLTRNLLAENFPQARIVGEAGNVAEGYALLQNTRPDLVLLDIDMPDGTGFDLLNRWETPPFKVIFITAFDQFAIKAFQCAAFDYLLKPFDPFLLIQGVQRLLESERLPNTTLQQLEALNSTFEKKRPDRLLIPHQNGFHVVPLEELLFVQSEGSYSYISSKNQSKILSSRPIAQYEDLLPAHDFLRVHQSYILNLREVRTFEQGDYTEATLSNGQKVPVSRRKKLEFVEALRKLSV